MDIFERMRNGELIKLDDPEYFKVYEAILRVSKITTELNSSYHNPDEIRNVISELIKSDIENNLDHDSFLHRFWTVYRIRQGCIYKSWLYFYG